MATKITRNLLRQYYGIGTTPTYHLCTPFTKMQEINNAETDEVVFINDVNGSPSVVGYANAFSFTAQVQEGDAVVDDLLVISRGQKTGADCERYVVDVDMNMADSVVGGSYYARKFKVAVACAPPTGNPKSITVVYGTMHQVGNMVEGLFDVATKTFTETAYTPAA